MTLKNFLFLPGNARLADLGLLLLRCATGLFLIYQSHDNVLSAERMDEFVKFLGQFGFSYPKLMAPLSVYFQFAAGIGFILGLFTRWLGLITCFNFIVAVWMVHSPDPFPTWWPALVLVFLGLYFGLRGSGRYGIDAMFEESCYPALMSAEFATEADIPAIMAIERTPGFEDVVGRWSHEQHSAELAKASTRYFVVRDGGEVKAFAIFQQIGEPDRRVHLKRIVTKDAGRGTGTRLLGSALDWLYAETETNRVDLDLFVENERARRTYERLGFIVEGRLRDYHRSVDGRIRDALIMSILRKDWARRHRL